MSTLYYITSNSLIHHGIKGQRWGIRRFQNEDGTLTAKGKKRYGDSESNDNPKPKKKSKHRLALEESYLKKGLSQEEAEKKASTRIKTETIVGVAAGVTLAAGAAYLVNRHLKGKVDGVVKAGTELQRVEMNDDGVLHDVFYAANKNSDKVKYAGLLGQTRKAQAGRAFVMKIGVGKNVKLAGQTKVVNIFKRLYENDSDFREDAELLSLVNVHGGNKVSGNDFKKMYENFNSNLVDRDNPAVKKFFSALKSEGYGAIRDVNDMKFSGYGAKNPLIFFGSNSDMSIKTIRELTDGEISKNINKALIRDTIEESLEDVGKQTLLQATVGTTAIAAGVYADSIRKHMSVTKHK